MKKLIRLSPVIFALYLLGALTVYYQLPPFQQLSYVKNNIFVIEKDSSDLKDAELLQFAFTDPPSLS